MLKSEQFPGDLSRDLNELEAFDAMRLFLEAFWRRGGKADDGIAVLLGSMNRNEGPPLDMAQWEDWLDAVSSVRRQRKSS